MRKKSILITGASGLVGQALQRASASYEHDFIWVHHSDFDLTHENQVIALYEKYKPDWVLHAAGKVGGVQYNIDHPDTLFYDNILMNTLMIRYAHQFSVKKFIAFISTCSFPADAPYISEEMLHQGCPHHTNFAYGYAKRMLDIQIQSYRKKYNVDYYSIIPANLYGSHDNFDIEAGHAIAALIHKCYLAKKNNSKVICWGDGSQTREFLFVDDLAQIALKLAFSNHCYDKIIVSNGSPINIRQLTAILGEIMQLSPEQFIFDESKPSGLPKRTCNNNILRKLLPDFQFTDYSNGLRKTVDWFTA